MSVYPGTLKSPIGGRYLLLLFLRMQVQNTHKPPSGWSPSPAVSFPNLIILPTFYQTPVTRKARLAEPELTAPALASSMTLDHLLTIEGCLSSPWL